MDVNLKIIFILAFVFIAIIFIIVIQSSGLANDMLQTKIENQFAGEASSRGDTISYLINSYLRQVNYLIHQV